MATPPARTSLSDTYPNPSDAVAKLGLGQLYDYVTGLLGSTGNPAEAMLAISNNILSVNGSSLIFSGTGKRITGDFSSNGTIANRVMFQTSTVNGATGVVLIPNGTGSITTLECSGASDPANSSVGQFATLGGSDVRIISTIRGTGTYLPMTFYTGGAERMRIDTDGNIGFGGTPTATAIVDIQSTTKGFKLPVMTTAQKTAIANTQALMVYDSTTGKVSINDGSTWGDVGGGVSIADDTSTNSTFYPMFASATSGAISTVKGSSTKLMFNPSTGTLSSTVFNSLSDASAKTNIVDSAYGLSTVLSLTSRDYNLIEDGSFHTGFISQEVELIMPHIVRELGNGKKGIVYNEIIPVLVRAVKELNDRLQLLELNNVRV